MGVFFNGTKKKILLCGAALSGNLGAEAMYDSVVDSLKQHNSEIEITILSKYPKDDTPGCEERGYTLLPYSTLYQLFCGGLFFVFGGVLKTLHLPHKFLARGSLRAYYDYDILVDASGIAFSDDRPISSLVINTLWFLPGFISGIPMIKVSQSLGPYKKWYVRLVSKLVLSRIHTIVCRGDISYQCTSELLPEREVYNLPDCAICLHPADETRTSELLQKYGVRAKEYIVLGPSFVMQDFVGSERYIQILSDCIKTMQERTKLPVLLVSHSAKHSKQLGVDAVHDDLSVCNLLSENVRGVVVVTETLSARELKSLIGNAYLAVGSRFHFLVAALSSGVPSLALGWSHKYRELFREFDLEQYVQVYQSLNSESVCGAVEKLIDENTQIREQLEQKLPDVKARSYKNLELVFELLKK